MKCPKLQFENPEDTLFCCNCTAPFHPAEEPEVTRTLGTPMHELTRGTLFAGRYEFIEEFGTGGKGKEIKHKRIRCFSQSMEPIEQTHYGSSP